MIKSDKEIKLSTGAVARVRVNYDCLFATAIIGHANHDSVEIELSAKDLRDLACLFYNARDDIEHNDPDVKEERF